MADYISAKGKGKCLLRSGEGSTTKIGYINPNEQLCHGTLGVKGTDHLQYSYRMECLICGYVYGANGSDVFQRNCPKCQNGMPGINYWLQIG